MKMCSCRKEEEGEERKRTKLKIRSDLINLHTISERAAWPVGAST
jgi:hypothetical protein